MRTINFLISAVIVLAVFLLFLGADYSLRSQSCEFCHSSEGSYAQWAIVEKAKEGFSHDQIACADCHIEGSSKGLFSAKLKGVSHVMKNFISFLDPREPGSVKPIVEKGHSERCRYCHISFDKIDAMHEDDLPEKLREIGLAMGHKKHFQTGIQECSVCHERFKKKGKELVEDKSVNYDEYPHMSCDSCHKYVAHAYKKFENFSSNDPYEIKVEKAWVDLSKNKRWKVDIPSEESCRRCHNGKIHFREKVFLANKQKDNNYNNCLKCHPSMTQEFFNNYTKERASPGTPAEHLAWDRGKK